MTQSLISGQSYKHFKLVNYDSKVVIWGIFQSGTTFMSVKCLQDWTLTNDFNQDSCSSVSISYIIPHPCVSMAAMGPSRN